METLVIYDTTGHILCVLYGNVYEPVGVPFLRTTVPAGKILKSVDVSVTPHVPVLEDTQVPVVEVLQEQINSLNLAIASMMGM